MERTYKIGILREGKQPPDKRVPFTPQQCIEIQKKYPNIELIVQSSDIRCFKDEEYISKGIKVRDDINECDILFGVKEVPVKDLIANKSYFFFSHTIKKQEYNRKLLQEILKKQIRLIDYEVLTDQKGLRIIGFGRYAGLVGAYNGLLTYGRRNQLYNLKPAHVCDDLAEMKKQISGLQLPPIKIAVTGGGRVANGAIELLKTIPVKEVSADEFLSEQFHEAVFTQLNPDAYNLHKEGKEFDLLHFFNNPEEYKGNFKRFCPQTDLLIAAAYWDPKSPVLFSIEDMQEDDFKISVIADITCDIEGSIPSTKKASTIDNPHYDFNPFTNQIEPAFSSTGNVTVMAVDNLPCELPKDASEDFGRNLIDKVLPHLLGNDEQEIISRATITIDGELTERFQYLSDYANS